MLGNIGFSEFVLIAIAALILFGPDKMPEIGRKLGRFVREFRSGTTSFLSEITRDPELRRTSGSTQAPTAASTSAEQPTVPTQTSPAAEDTTVAPAKVSSTEASSSSAQLGVAVPATEATESAAAAPTASRMVRGSMGLDTVSAITANSAAESGIAEVSEAADSNSPSPSPAVPAATAKPRRAPDARRLPE